MQEKKENLIVIKSIDFALKIISFSEVLEEKRKYVIARQVLRSGTSIGANIHEAQNAESKADFIHKLKIAAKEAEESIYWLILCQNSKNYPKSDDLIQQCRELVLILGKIISSSKRKK
jgi:four helix bundle protein